MGDLVSTICATRENVNSLRPVGIEEFGVKHVK